MIARNMEAEALIFWRCARTLAAIKLLPALTPALLVAHAEASDDMEAIAMHSDWPRLQAAASQTLVVCTLDRVAV